MDDSCLKALCGLGVAAGAFVLGSIGLTAAVGALEVLGKGGEFAIDVASSQRNALETLEAKVQANITRNYRAWLRTSKSEARNEADIEMALAELAPALKRARPTLQDIAGASRARLDGQPGTTLGHALLRRLEPDSIFRTSDAAAGIFVSLVDTVAGLASSDAALMPHFEAVRFDIIMDGLEAAARDRARNHEAQLDAHRETQARLERLERLFTEGRAQPGSTGPQPDAVPIAALRPIFSAVEHEMPEASDADLVRHVEAAVAELLKRSEQKPQAFNDSVEITSALAVARQQLAQLNVDGALAHLRAAREERAALRLELARGEARLAREEAAILKSAYRWDEAIAAYETAAALDPDYPWSNFTLGDIWRMRGSLARAEAAYAAGGEAARRVGIERAIALSHTRIGDLRMMQGRLDDAAAEYAAGHAIGKVLAQADPGDAEAQRDLSVNRDRIGDIRAAQGRLDEAVAEYEAARRIRAALAEAEPDNADRQRDLSVSYDKIGALRQIQGRLDDAAEAYQSALDIAERLAARDPGNARWQGDHAIGHNRIGELRRAQGRLDEAIAAYERGRAITAALVTADPGNVEWQRDLSISYDRLGSVWQEQGKLDEAAEAYAQGLTICRALAARDPANLTWQHEVAISLDRMGNLRLAQGRPTDAIAPFEEGRTITVSLIAADTAYAAKYRRNLIVDCVKLAELGCSPRDNIAEALATAQHMAETGQLSGDDAWMVADLERRLAEIDARGIVVAWGDT